MSQDNARALTRIISVNIHNHPKNKKDEEEVIYTRAQTTSRVN